MNRHTLLAALTLAGAALTAAEPGRAIRMIPQSGISKTFKIVTDTDIELSVQFFRADVFRILAAPGGHYADPKNNPEKAQILADATEDASRVTFADTPEHATFTTTALTLTLDKATCRFTLLRPDGTPIWQELAPLNLTSNLTTQTLSSAPAEYYYGGGQQNGHFSHKGTRIDIRADGKWDEGGHPNPAPFYMSNAGYGTLRHTFSPGAYDFTDNSRITLQHNENRFDALYFVAPTFNRIIDLYTQFTGRPNFLPIWGLELGDADAYMTRDKETKAPKQRDDGTYVEITPDAIPVAQSYREHDMPGGWILVNDGYGCGHLQLPYTVKALASLGFHTGLWTEGALDLTAWEVGTAGTRVQKLDVAWTGPAYQHALECNRIAHTSLETNSDSRGFVWTVQGWAGTQRYGICWTGDQYGSWDLIRYHIPTLTGSGLSGQAYATTDVDGIFGGSPETYTRDLQWKCFTPALYVMNGWSNLNKSPWAYPEPYRSINRDYLKLKMRLTPLLYTYCRQAYDTGAPIVRPLLWNYPQDPKTWDNTTQYQFMLGSELLIAPVYTSMKVNRGWRKNIYLPQGAWVDYHDGRLTTGPATLEAYPVTLEKLPVFVRAGAIIPMYPEMLYNNQRPKDPLTFDVYPHGRTAFTLYEDDGLTRAYKTGAYTTQTITCAAPEDGLPGDILITLAPPSGDYQGKPHTRAYTFQIHTRAAPRHIMLGDQELLRLTATNNLQTAYDNALQTWYHDPADRHGILHIKLAPRPTGQPLTLHIAHNPAAEIAPTPPYPVPEITHELDKTEFTLTCDSEQGGSGINNAFDGSPETIWHSNYGKKDPEHTHPYTITIDLGRLAAVNGLGYLPRQNFGNGSIKGYEIYLSRHPGTFGAPVAKGEFQREYLDPAAEKKEPKYQTVGFTPTWARHMQIKVLSSLGGDRFGSAAEFDILQDLDQPPLPDENLYLADLKPLRATGPYANDKGLKAPAIRVDDTPWARGTTVRAGTELTYPLDGTYDRLMGHVGMEDAQGDGGLVTFRVFADDQMIFERLGMYGAQVKQLLDVNIPPAAKELRLTLTPEPGGSPADTGVWVDTRLVRKGSE